MGAHLNRIENWLQLAQEANWSVAVLAKNCGVTVRTLERHFNKNMGTTPKRWIAKQKQQKVLKLLEVHHSVKETAVSLGYRHPTQFSHEFKMYWGCPPTSFRFEVPPIT